MKQATEKELLARKVFSYLKPKFKYDPYIKLACKRRKTTISNMLRIVQERLQLLSIESLKLMDDNKAENYLEFRLSFIEISFMDDKDILAGYRDSIAPRH